MKSAVSQKPFFTSSSHTHTPSTAAAAAGAAFAAIVNTVWSCFRREREFRYEDAMTLKCNQKSTQPNRHESNIHNDIRSTKHCSSRTVNVAHVFSTVAVLSLMPVKHIFVMPIHQWVEYISFSFSSHSIWMLMKESVFVKFHFFFVKKCKI